MKKESRPASGTDANCHAAACGCRPAAIDFARRDFLKLAGLTATGLALGKLPIMAGPFTREDFDHLVPADKKLRPEWIKSLFARGTPEVLRGDELKYVGMPVGGICTGQLYLGGDGRLWHWDIFNDHYKTGADHYAKPPAPDFPLQQGFALRLGGRTVALNASGFREIGFRGEYPIGRVEYRDDAVPLTVNLEAFSPFIPLNTDDSSLPATILAFTLRNPSAASVEATLSGELENGVCLHHRQQAGLLRNRILRGPRGTTLLCSAEKAAAQKSTRPDIVFEDWSKDTYDGWQIEGTAFGRGPVRKSDIPAYQGDVGGDTEHVVNSHASAPGGSTSARDKATGKLISRAFTVERDGISLWIGGGKARANSRFGVTLFVDGKPVQTLAGQNQNKMTQGHLDVRAYAGKTARLEILDDVAAAWGNIGVGKIVFTDEPPAVGPLEELPDYGTMALTLLGAMADETSTNSVAPFAERLSGSLGRKFQLAPGASVTVTFLLTWNFPHLTIPGVREKGRFYATKFAGAVEVARYVVENFDRLTAQTRLWRDVWYDSTLPYWLLDRTQLNSSILASSTCYRLASGRFWAWEGVGCCAGTCSHVWHYAHSAARQFPELERLLREQVDFDVAMQPDGAINFRGENNKSPAVDGQAGVILRTLREHQMCTDDAFLRRVWPKVKRATDWLIAKDGNGDGIIEGNQHNTLDADWFGPVAWLSGLYLTALAAAATLAEEMSDDAYAEKCRAILARGPQNLVAKLFDGEYFINRVDPKHLDAINSGTGCEIDQVMGQSWAFQVGLPRVLPEKETRSALQSLWKYNFSPDVGPYRAANKPGRWYAMTGEAGLLMCTFPRRDWDYEQARGKGAEWAAGYFNECMNGFEYQVAGHMLWEGLTLEGLAVTRAVHDRYHASRRNPWNEVECGDHYARSMASYGVYLAACGFEYHGPKGRLGFAPRLTPEDFRCAFTAAEGWGTFAQKQTTSGLRAEIVLRWGSLHLSRVALQAPAEHRSAKVTVTLDGKKLPASLQQSGRDVEVVLPSATRLHADQSLIITLE